MFTVKVQDGQTFKTDVKIDGKNFSGTFDGRKVTGDFLKVGENQYHLLFNNKSHNIELIRLQREEKTLVLKIDSVKITVQLQDKYDELLHSLGLDNLNVKKVNDIKAPMPGMVLNVLVKAGDAVKKGDPLLVLEAMKMENILKSPTEGTVKNVVAKKGSPVEKNELLIQF